MDQIDFDAETNPTEREKLQASWHLYTLTKRIGVIVGSSLLLGILPGITWGVSLLYSMNEKQTTTARSVENMAKTVEAIQADMKNYQKKVDVMWYVGGWETKVTASKQTQP